MKIYTLQLSFIKNDWCFKFQAADELYKIAFRIDSDTGDVIINSSLDFERHNFYEFVIKAKVSKKIVKCVMHEVPGN